MKNYIRILSDFRICVFEVNTNTESSLVRSTTTRLKIGVKGLYFKEIKRRLRLKDVVQGIFHFLLIQVEVERRFLGYSPLLFDPVEYLSYVKSCVKDRHRRRIRNIFYVVTIQTGDKYIRFSSFFHVPSRPKSRVDVREYRHTGTYYI